MLTFDFSGLQIHLRPGKVPFATVPNIRLARQMSDNIENSFVSVLLNLVHLYLINFEQ